MVIPRGVLSIVSAVPPPATRCVVPSRAFAQQTCLGGDGGGWGINGGWGGGGGGESAVATENQEKGQI